MMDATLTERANGGIVPSMATQPQTETAPPPAAACAGVPFAGREQRDPTPLASKEPETSPPAWRMAVDRIKGDLLPFSAAMSEPWDYRPVPPFVLDEDGYLIDDAMPQNDGHAERMVAYAQVLKAHYRGRGGMVGVDLSMQYVRGSPNKMVAPDLFVALAAEERKGRRSYKLWEEPVPDFVLEDLSPSNWRLDAVVKRRLYRRLGVREYWLFDETGIRLREVLVGYRLRGKRYMRIRANAAGRLPSEVLGLELAARDGLLRFFNPATGEYLRILEESERFAMAERRGREAAELRAMAAEREREAAERRAAAERRQKEAERREKEAAQARIAELEAKLAAQPDAE